MAVAAFDLFELFVVQTFGSFWLAILGLSLFMFVIMAVFGKMGYASVADYLTAYWFAMALGYGYRTLAIFLFLGALTWFWYQVAKAVSSGGQ